MAHHQDVQFDEVPARRIGGVAIERPRNEAPSNVPVALRTVQHVKVSHGRFEQTWSKRIVMAKWAISGLGCMKIGSQRFNFGPGMVAIYLPTIPHCFWALKPVNEFCWFTLDGPLAEEFVLQLGLNVGVFNCTPPPLEKIYALMDGLKDHTLQGCRRCSLAAIQMLYDLANSIRSPKTAPLVQRARNIIEQEFADPDLSAERIAAELSYHRGSLSRLFHKQTGVTIIDYLTHVRLQEAKSLLRYTPDKIAAVAEKCGFREATYFCRWIRKHTGKTAGELRQSE
ncbi:MAG TPA: AraC family transcriptional regulator [Tepidisphaeraceae bacterium]|jgi:AraC-like DNA-binding protein|nr:AraC family transcriptional regulator [Tepidisphaeraceae bacterium]